MSGTYNTIDYYIADVISAVDYGVWGDELTNRSFLSGNNRYGFNGMEKDDEMKGSGNSYDFGARIYETRLGRFLSIDPRQHEFAQWSPYNFAGNNNPIRYIDLNGEGPWDIAAEVGRLVLDCFGMVPVIGEVADGVSALIDVANGELVDAGVSAASMIPVWGWIPGAKRIASRSAKIWKMIFPTKTEIDVPSIFRVARGVSPGKWYEGTNEISKKRFSFQKV